MMLPLWLLAGAAYFVIACLVTAYCSYYYRGDVRTEKAAFWAVLAFGAFWPVSVPLLILATLYQMARMLHPPKD